MKFPSLQRFYTGVAVQVSGLRTERSEGTGDFFDLISLAEWCSSCGLDLIQLLPVQDTGYHSSPYSALSAFALHPLYLRLSEIPEGKALRADVERFAAENAGSKYLKYEKVLRGKLGLLKRMFEAGKQKIEKDQKIRSWVEENSWVKNYSVFMTLKESFNSASWREWPRMQEPTREEIEAFWKDPENRDQLLFHVWVQFRLDEQFGSVSKKLDSMGILLKGDLPILMNEDSADVWSNRNFFDLSFQAGAPPDYYSMMGQNWGFPIYNWDNLKKEDYSWWRSRLRHAARFYHAFRIDHVLGFFRIWSIPHSNITGYLGHFKPAHAIKAAELTSAGFDAGRIRWLSVPHVPLYRLWETVGGETPRALDLCFDRIGNEELFNFKPAITGERDIYSLDLSSNAKDKLAMFFRDRVLTETEPGVFFPVWTYTDTTAYRSLSDGEKERLNGLVTKYKEDSDRLWKKNGKLLLSFMKEETDMLPCAEDLGAVPRSVPGVLEELSILSLKIPRWAKNFMLPGEPMIPIGDYPFLSVCTPSVHDTSTLREWWYAEGGACEFWQMLGFESPCPESYTPEAARKVVHALLGTSSCMCIFQIQELLDLEGSLRDDVPEDSRINIPGTLNEKNWSYRITPTLEQLKRNMNLIVHLRDHTTARARRKTEAKKTGRKEKTGTARNE